ncbi:hypothetical protein [Cohnella zeiphila]|uniref:Uncharacterized protein n=1 Tax=Cohnella zeiphila TaxID=2761120 RepID=A0A7X0VV89_9BACL|nr:hypothetical protein [Cohnella zeiphila]MBB6731889.1 hypothetical protein [Cohnella zeiphila]
MTQASTNSTFKNQALANATGVSSTAKQEITVEFLAADPADKATNFPRIWVNTTTGALKYTVDGSTVKTATVT